jgi:OOP family OmpA-OmpF porin
MQMSDSSSSGEGERKPKSSNGSDQKLNELRNILFPEREQIESLQEQLENPELMAENVSRVLPNAVRMRTARDDDLTQAMSSTVEQAIRISVRKNPRPLVDAIFPVMGPAIRRAISAAISGLIQSLNQTLEYSLSIRGLKWRWEAIRTGKPFAEIVLLHSLLYRVEQIFLIHRESGLLLQHVSSVPSQSADLISGMLTAIQDFVRDSFHVQDAETLETLRVGELSIWIEQGPHAILAAVIRGNAPQDLRSTFQNTLEMIHIEKGKDLQDFQGDPSPFESVRADLEDCLLSQYQKAKKKQSTFAAVAIGLVIGLIILWLSFLFLQRYRFHRFVDRLNQEPGIAVTSVQKRGGKYYLKGLRDPLAADPSNWVEENGLATGSVVFQWEPYQAIQQNFVLLRSKRILNPPAGVTLDFKNGILHASGKAPHSWILETQKLAKVIPGVERFDESGLLEAEAEEMYALKKRIEERVFRFVVGTNNLVDGQEEDLEATARDLDRIGSAAGELKKDVKIEIIGHTDTTGDEMGNRQLSQSRADSLIQFFSSKGVPINIFEAVGKASEEPVRSEQSEQDREWNRSVTFRVNWTESEN